MATIKNQMLERALELQQAGQLDEAERLYQDVLAVWPDQPDAWHGLGVIFHQRGQDLVAIESIERAIRLQGTQAIYHFNLGHAFQALGRHPEAMACYRRSLHLNPVHDRAYVSLGLELYRQGVLAEARDCFLNAVALNPECAESENLLGNAWNDLGNPQEALGCYQRALELKPDFLAARLNAGNVWQDLGNLDAAVACYGRVLEQDPNFAEAHNNLGNVWKSQGKLDQALGGYRCALELNPLLVQAHLNCGNIHREQGRLDEAQVAYQRALELDPGYPEAHLNLGNLYRELGRLEQAVASYQRALELRPSFPEACNNLGNVWKDLGQLEAAVASYQRALELKPGYRAAHSNLLCAFQYRADVTLQELAKASAEYDRRHAEPLRVVPSPVFQNSRNPARRLRLGFVSPDFGQHPVGFFLIGALENLDPTQFETVCYSDRVLHDSWTGRFQAASRRWREVAGLSDAELADQIRRDEIDILFDLAGHTDRNRLLLFARKPAPIQISWIGHEGTTGLQAMDAILADWHTIPSGREPWYRERVLRLPRGYVCWEPPANAPEVGPLPALKAGFIRFGSLNNPAKVTPSVVELWAKVLHRVPNSRLLLKYRGFGEELARSHYRRLFEGQGIDAACIEFEPGTAYPGHLAAYQRMDIALDPFPFGGAVTTCDALWMGVPVITCPGETFASRHGLSHLASAGLTETIAGSFAEYVAIAAALAADLPVLSRLRAGLRDRVANSPLCDGTSLARDLGQVLREVWAEWCSEPAKPG